MIYKIDNTPLSFFDAFASPGRNATPALSGFMDLPKRLGKTEHNWGTSIEPFVAAEDIELDGRTLTLRVAVSKSKLNELKSACIACKAIYCDAAKFDVICKDEIKVTEVGAYYIAKIKFWEQAVSLPSLPVLSYKDGPIQIDQYNFSDLGVYVAKGSGLKDLSKRIEVATTLPYSEARYRNGFEISIDCYLKGVSHTDVYNRSQQLNAILIAPGIRSLKYGENSLNLYFKNGVSYKYVAKHIIKFSLKATAVYDNSI